MEIKELQATTLNGGKSDPKPNLRDTILYEKKNRLIFVGDYDLGTKKPEILYINTGSTQVLKANVPEGLPSTSSLYFVSSNENYVITGGYAGTFLLSQNGIDYQVIKSGITEHFVNACFLDGLFYIITSAGTLVSFNPLSKAFKTCAVTSYAKEVVTTPKGIMIAHTGGRLTFYNTTTGKTNTIVPGSTNFNSAIYTESGYYLLGGGADTVNQLIRSKNPDGGEWEVITEVTGPYYMELIEFKKDGKNVLATCGNGDFSGGGSDKKRSLFAFSLDDGKTWIWPAGIDDYSSLLSISHRDGSCYACGARGLILCFNLSGVDLSGGSIVNPPIEPDKLILPMSIEFTLDGKDWKFSGNTTFTKM